MHKQTNKSIVTGPTYKYENIINISNLILTIELPIMIWKLWFLATSGLSVMH